MKFGLKTTLSTFLIAATTGAHAQAQCVAQTAELLAPDGSAEDFFGGAVVLDGGVLMVGAHGDDEQGVAVGSAYLIDVASGTQLQKLVRGDAGDYNYFGFAVDLAGGTAVVGALGDDDLGNFAGAAYVYDAATGSELHKLHASDGEAADRFGYSVAVDGGRVLVGAAYDDTLHGDVGSAYLFDRATGQELMKLEPSDKNAYERFGSAVALHGDLAVIGAPGDNANGYNAGAVYLFDVSTGAQLAKLIASDGETKAGFGDAVDLDGTTVVVGAPGFVASAMDIGKAYLFDAASGLQTAILQPDDGEVFDAFGYSVAVDGERVLVGAITDDDMGDASGSAYLFDVASGVQTAKLVAPNGTGGDYFGFAAIEGDVAAVGASGSDTLAMGAGSVYVYDLGVSGANYCQATPNSTGMAASLTACGSLSLAANDLTLSAYPVPNQFALFFHASAANQLPFGDGFLCATGSVTRLNPPAQAVGHLVTRTLDLPSDGVLFAGTYHFQCWYRDPAAGGSGFNLTDGVALTLVP